MDRCSKTLVAVHAAGQRGNSHPTAELAATAWGILAAIDLQGCDRSRLADPDRPDRPAFAGFKLPRRSTGGRQRGPARAAAPIRGCSNGRIGHPRNWASFVLFGDGSWTVDRAWGGGVQVHGGRGRQTPLRLAQGVVRRHCRLGRRRAARLEVAIEPARQERNDRSFTDHSAPTTTGYPANMPVADPRPRREAGRGRTRRTGSSMRRRADRREGSRCEDLPDRQVLVGHVDVLMLKGSATSNSRWQARCTCAAPAPSRVSTSAVASAP